MALSPFDPTAYYRFSNAVYAYTGISTGFKNENTPPHLGLTPYGSRSSENWQIYRQRDSSGRSVYLIRNYDYGADLQLGLTEQLRTVPRLRPRSGDLGQQWRMSRDSWGRWILTNELLGNGSYLGVSPGDNSGQYTTDVPSMQPTPDGTEKWVVTINVSAGEITQKEALEDLELVQVPAPSSTSPSISSSTSSSIPSSISSGTSLTTPLTTSSLSPILSPQTPTPSAYVSAACLSISPTIGSLTNLISGTTAIFIFLILFCAAVTAYCRKQRKHEYQPVQASKGDEKSEDLREGLPV